MSAPTVTVAPRSRSVTLEHPYFRQPLILPKAEAWGLVQELLLNLTRTAKGNGERPSPSRAEGVATATALVLASARTDTSPLDEDELAALTRTDPELAARVAVAQVSEPPADVARRARPRRLRSRVEPATVDPTLPTTRTIAFTGVEPRPGAA